MTAARTVAALLLVSATSLAAAPAPDDAFRALLSRDTIGASAFTRAHPEWDGRGKVVVAVLDTGVDMHQPGLRELPGGGVKVVDARDFSGQGDVALEKATVFAVDDVDVLAVDAGTVPYPTGIEPPLDGAFWVGFLDEARFRNSEVSDINGNGSTADRFAMLVVRAGTAAAPVWTLYPDRNGDGRFDDAVPVRSYVDGHETFTLTGTDPKRAVPPLAFAATILDDGPKLSLHFVDGSHGSHVAGIAAGYRIHGEEGYDGIAPGARVLSLKIGDNSLPGGATTTGSMKKALEYAAEWSRTRGDFVVVNMSYGIASEMEGRHEIDTLVDTLVTENPRLAIATSAGNEGPGLSTVGTPSGATLAFAAGALLTQANARELYGARFERDRLFAFSARGGELDKPDALAPGVAASTVPDWERFDIFRGTSMASPQIAGAMALLASAAGGEEPPLAIHAGMLYRALRWSARPLPDMLPIEQGGGLVDVPAAWEALQRFAKRGEARGPLGYAIETLVPTQPDAKAPAAMWRTGGYVPTAPLGQRFEVRALLPRTLSARERQDVYARYDLRADVGWIDLDRDTVALRAELPSPVVLTYDADALREPGVYTGRVLATPTNGSGRGDTAFTLTTTVVVPHRFGPAEHYRLERRGETLPLGELRRWFVMVPPGATTLDVRLRPKAGAFAFVGLAVFDPSGRQRPVAAPFADSAAGSEARATVSAEELVPAGTYEVVAYADYARYAATGKASTFDLDVRFAGVAFEPPVVTHAPGGPPTATLALRNAFDERFLGRATVEVDGVERVTTHTVAEDTFRQEFQLDPSLRGVTFEIAMSPEDYARFTDVAINVLDAAGAAVHRDGMMGVRAVVPFAPESPSGTFTLEVRGGRARPDGKPFTLTLTERYLYRTPIGATATAHDSATFALYPGVSTPVVVTLSATPPQAPTGFAHTGTLRLVGVRDDARWLQHRFRL